MRTRKPYFWTTIFFAMLSVFAFLGTFVWATWSNPTNPPPGGDGAISFDATSGNVGVGTNAPTTKLDINGGIRIRGFGNCNALNTNSSGNVSCGSSFTKGIGNTNTYFIVKQIDESRTSGSLTNDAELFYGVPANRMAVIDLYVIAKSTFANDNFNFTLASAVNSGILACTYEYFNGDTMKISDCSNTTHIRNLPNANIYLPLHISVMVANYGVIDAPLYFKWFNGNSSATVTVKKGSFINVTTLPIP